MNKHEARSDRAGMIIAAVCFVHCVAGPALLTFAGLISLIHISKKFEIVFLAGSAAMGVLALIPGYRKRHGRKSCLAIFASGFAALIVGKFVDDALTETAIGLTGSCLIVIAHFLNVRYSRHCACCDAVPHQTEEAE